MDRICRAHAGRCIADVCGTTLPAGARATRASRQMLRGRRPSLGELEEPSDQAAANTSKPHTIPPVGMADRTLLRSKNGKGALPGTPRSARCTTITSPCDRSSAPQNGANVRERCAWRSREPGAAEENRLDARPRDASRLAACLRLTRTADRAPRRRRALTRRSALPRLLRLVLLRSRGVVLFALGVVLVFLRLLLLTLLFVPLAALVARSAPSFVRPRCVCGMVADLPVRARVLELSWFVGR